MIYYVRKLSYLNKKYHFYTKTFDNKEELKLFVDKNFRELIGKIYCKEESQNALIYASLSEDCYLEGFNKFELTN